MHITVDGISFDVLSDHYAKRGFAALPATPTMAAPEIIAMRGKSVQYWLTEIDAEGNDLRIWGQELMDGGWDETHRNPTEAIILTDGMRFATLPPCGF